MTLTPERLKEIRDRWNSGHITPRRTVGELLAHIDELEAQLCLIKGQFQQVESWAANRLPAKDWPHKTLALYRETAALTASAKEKE